MGDDLGFAIEALFTCGVGRKMGRKNLDRNGAFQSRIAGAGHFPHPAGTQRPLTSYGPSLVSATSIMVDVASSAKQANSLPASAGGFLAPGPQ